MLSSEPLVFEVIPFLSFVWVGFLSFPLLVVLNFLCGFQFMLTKISLTCCDKSQGACALR